VDRVVLIRRRRPGYVGPLHGMQLVIVELVLFGALTALAYGAFAASGVAILAAVVLGLTLARWRGRWLLERRVMVWRYRRRRRLADAAGPATSALAALRRLSPDLTVTNVRVPGGRQVGVAQDDAGWFAAATVTPGVLPVYRPDVPLDVLAASVADADQAGAVVQVVISAAPTATAGAASPAEQSYRDLLTRVGSPSVPADRTISVVVRIDARGLAEAIGDHNADFSSAPLVAASLLRRLVTSLRQADVSASMMDADALTTFLAESCDPEPAAGDHTAAYRERWSTFRASRIAHRTFWISHWPSPARAQALHEARFAGPTPRTTLSFVLDPDPRSGLVDLTALGRVSASANDLGRAARAMARAARVADADLFPLDGEQAPGTYASAPTGGGAR
jgi:type VII secretion protein EccE